MKENLIGKAKIKDGAVVGVDFSFVTWKDSGEIFDVYTFSEDRKKLVADGYGNLDKPNAYGSGALFVKNTDVIFCEDTPVTTPTEPISVHSGLEKIEPLSMVYTGHTENGISYCTGSRPADNRELMTKLNEVIEAVNKMMEVINKGVKE